MGVPKFYRWISERYPCLSEVVKEYQIPEFDNLYLDMNGIIHNCSHPNDDDPHFRITEEKIFADIFHYIEVLFRLIQPRKVFFMAIDGVAPRAKMNQQRGRRFRSAKEAEQNEKKAKDRGEVLPKEERFDSNCITPGTPFMDRLHQQLKYFVVNKISTDSLWRNTRVILSGHETPGEGEHKIMDFIRYEKAQPGYDPNTRHCLYGLDADLLMLGLCSHDPHFSLLREEVKFGGRKSQAAKRTPTPEEITFHLLHLSLLREYLNYEFQELHSLPFYNLENIIDDWVLMGFLVGNDFIPHLPNMHINKGALPELYNAYKAVLPTLGGYLNEAGYLNLPRFQRFMETLSQYELEKFDDIYSDAKWLEGKTARKNLQGRTEVEPTPGPGHVYEMLGGMPEPGVNTGPLSSGRKSDLQQLVASTREFDSSGSESDPLDTSDSEARGNFYQMEFRQHKRDYYIHKLGYAQVNEEALREQAEGYVRAIQWNLHYYYNGCVSWSWFYPHHFSPWITDIRNFAGMRMDFQLSTPFLPFEQLLAVLPAASKSLLPTALQWLMTSEESPIINYYPLEFEQDLNGKQQDWEAVVLIPFIEEDKLLSAMKPLYPRLTAEEAARNKHGPMWVCIYSQESLGRYEAPAYFPPVERHHCHVTELMRDSWELPVSRLRKGLMKGVKLDTFFPGFPTLQHINHTAKLKKAQVRVFEQTSRGESMILTLGDQGRPTITEVAKAMIGKEVWVGWPHLVEAKVRGVSTAQALYLEPCRASNPPHDWNIQAKEFSNRLFNRYGIEIGDTQILVHACPMAGRKYVFGAQRERITLEKQWHLTQQLYALQTVVADIDVHDSAAKQYKTIEELFSAGTSCFMLGEPHYGALGTVVKIDPEHKGRIQLRFAVPNEPDFRQLFSQQAQLHEKYDTAYRAAQYLGISSHLLSRLTGTIFLIRGAREQQMESASRTNIGLNLKFNKRNEEVAGFTKKVEGGWTYSRACVDILREYQARFPEVFLAVSASNGSNSGSNGNDMFHELDVFEEDTASDRVRELITWLEGLPTATASRQPFGTQTLSDTLITAIEKMTQGAVTKEVTMQVRPHLLYLPNQFAGSSLVDPNTTFYLFDRVVNVREGFSVPLGLRGTLVRIQKGAKPADNLYDVIFDAAFTGGLTLRCSPGRGYRLPGSALINISYKEQTQWIPEKYQPEKPRAVVRPYDSYQQENSSAWQQRDQKPNQDQKPRQDRDRDQRREARGATAPPPQPPCARSLPPPPSHMQMAQLEQSSVRILQRGGSAGKDLMNVGRGNELQQHQQLIFRQQSHYQQQRGGNSIHQSQAQMEQMWMMMQSGGGGGTEPQHLYLQQRQMQMQQQQGRGRGMDWRQQGRGRGGNWQEEQQLLRGRGRGAEEQNRNWRDDLPQQQLGRGRKDQGRLKKPGGGRSLFEFEDPMAPAYLKNKGRGQAVPAGHQQQVEDMEQGLKRLLNISGGLGSVSNPLLDPPEESTENKERIQPQQKSVGRGRQRSADPVQPVAEGSPGGGRRQESYQQKLRRMLYARGAQVPRYEIVRDPTTGRIEGQVSFEGGAFYTSDAFMESTEAAYESAAKNAVIALKISAGSKTEKANVAAGVSFVPLQVAQRAVKSKERSQSQETEDKKVSANTINSSNKAPAAVEVAPAEVMPGRYPREGNTTDSEVKNSADDKAKTTGAKKKVKLAANFAALGGPQ